MEQKEKGFTLVELSIVLTLIALIIGSVLVGRSLIRTSQVNSILADIQLFKQATADFKQKYGELPGDLTTATSYWGTDSSCPISATLTPKVLTCNGNGDGHIDLASGEYMRVWQHLANAGMIPGSYSGASSAVPGVSLPASKVPGGTYYYFYWGIGSGGSVWFGAFFNGDFGNAIDFNGSLLTPAEAKALDAKADDGIPGHGWIYGYGSGTCVTSYTNDSATYNISNTDKVCIVMFVTGF